MGAVAGVFRKWAVDDSVASRLEQMKLLGHGQITSVLESFQYERKLFNYQGSAGNIPRSGEHHLVQLVASCVSGNTEAERQLELAVAGLGQLRANLALITMLEIAAALHATRPAGDGRGERGGRGPTSGRAVELVELMCDTRTRDEHAIGRMIDLLESDNVQANLAAYTIAVCQHIAGNADSPGSVIDAYRP